jgi:hypothetical protein
MKIYANRYGLIESHELAFALRADEERRRTAAGARKARRLRHAELRERVARALRAGAAWLAAVRLPSLPAAFERARS